MRVTSGQVASTQCSPRAAACSGEVQHGRHVAKLAGRIYEQLQTLYPLKPDDRPFLEAAARLQDVGYLINTDTGSFVLKGIYFGLVARY